MRPLIFIFAASLASGRCSEPLTPSTPPLLEKVTAVGGWWNGGCPPKDKTEAELYKPADEALSPDLMDRLASQFPIGTSASHLAQSLKQQGFSFRHPCVGLSAIRLGEFRQTGGEFYGPYPIGAQVAWQQDAAGRILWAKGTVMFTGP